MCSCPKHASLFHPGVLKQTPPIPCQHGQGYCQDCGVLDKMPSTTPGGHCSIPISPTRVFLTLYTSLSPLLSLQGYLGHL